MGNDHYLLTLDAEEAATLRDDVAAGLCEAEMSGSDPDQFDQRKLTVMRRILDKLHALDASRPRT